VLVTLQPWTKTTTRGLAMREGPDGLECDYRRRSEWAEGMNRKIAHALFL
jgi:hypothetical protein